MKNNHSRLFAASVGVFLFLSLCFSSPISAEETMKMVYFDSFPPFSWKAEDGTMKGILIDVVQEIVGNQMGIPLTHQGFPWARAQQMVKEGDADAFVTVPTDARRAYTDIGAESVVPSRMTLFTKKGHPKTAEFEAVKNIEDLKAFKLIDYRGNGWGDRNLASHDRYLTDNLESVFKMLDMERGDLCVTDSVIAGYTLKNLGLQDKIVEIPVVLDEVPFCLCIGKQSPFVKILGDFDAKLKAFREEGKLQAIYDKYR